MILYLAPTKNNFLELYIHPALFAISQTNAWIVSLGFWTLLAAPLFSKRQDAYHYFIFIVAHSFNLIFAVIALFLSKTTLSWFHLVYPLIFMALYITSVLITFFYYQDDWPYPFLRIIGNTPSEFKVGIFLMALAAISLVILLSFSWNLFLIRFRDKGSQSTTSGTEEIQNGDPKDMA